MAIISGIIGVDLIGAFVLGEPLPTPPTLEDVLPDGTNRWVGFFTGYPTSANGTGGTESSVSRLPVSEWETENERRIALERLEFDITTGEVLVGIGVWDAEVGGELLAFEPTQHEVGHPTIIAVSPGDVVTILEGDLVLGFTVCESIVTSHTDDYCPTLLQLLPQGLAWRLKKDGLLYNLLCGMSFEFSRVETRARDLINEADPRTTVELLEDWERVLGLPGNCESLGSTTAARQAAAAAKLTQKTSPTDSYFQELTESFGYTGVIIHHTLHDPFTCVSNCNDSLYGGPWAYAWGIQTNESLPDDAVFQCLVQEVSPFHTTVVFYHGTTPP